MDRRDRDRM